MKKIAVILMFSMGIALCGCADTAESEGVGKQMENTSESEMFETQTETASEAGIIDGRIDNLPDTEVTQGGPYGEISISVPAGWSYEVCPIDSDDLMLGMYGIHFYPDGVKGGYVELAYVATFGVCGTGLEEESVTIAGDSANVGTYDGHEYWDFVSFRGENKGIVAMTYSVGDWWGEYGDQVIDILNTLSFHQDVREGGAYVYNEASRIEEIGLGFSLKKISSTGATLVFNQNNADAPNGELIYGDDFAIEVQNNDEWEKIPVVVEGAYGFNAIAYTITPGDMVEREIDWEWLYGELAPGEYRIGKSISDFVESGNSKKYTIYAYFILN